MNSLLQKIIKTFRHNFLPENRSTTVIELIAVLVWMGSTFVFYYVLGQVVPELDFLKDSGGLNIIASYFVVDGLIYSLLFRNLHDLGKSIEDGKFGEYLLIPTDTIQYVSFRNIQFSSMIQVPIAFEMLILFGEFHLLSFIFWIFSITLGFIIAYQVWLLMSYLSFWYKAGNFISIIYEELTIIGMFPLKIFLSSTSFLIFGPFLLIASGGGDVLNGNLGGMFVLVQLLIVSILYLVERIVFVVGVSYFRR